MRYKTVDIENIQSQEISNRTSGSSSVKENDGYGEVEEVNAEETQYLLWPNYVDLAKEIEIEAESMEADLENIAPFQHQTTLKTYCPTRWHSLLTMTKSMIDNSVAINFLLSKIQMHID